MTATSSATPGTIGPDWHRSVLTFWFEELKVEQWFKKDASVDEAITDRFGAVYETVRMMEIDTLIETPDKALAAIIVLDQFSRNMFRNDPRTFESDALALKVADRALAAGLDAEFDADQRHFLCMPFMHSESLADQDRAIALFEAIGKEEGVKYAKLHRDVIVKFGRFPHRNAVLGRQTTPEEQAHLDEHGGF